MIFAFIFFVFTVVFLGIGEAIRTAPVAGSGVPAALFYLAAASEFFTGALYFSAAVFKINPGIIFKTPEGRIRLLPRLLSWVYLIFEYKGWKRYRKKTSEPIFEKVREGLYLGARIKNRDLKLVKEHRICAVLDMVAEFEAPSKLRESQDLAYIAIPVLDGSIPTIAQLEKGAQFLARSVENNAPALVHCTFGHGRSATMAAAALIRMGDAEDPAQALEILGRLKRRIWLSREQKNLLARFHRRYNQGENQERTKKK